MNTHTDQPKPWAARQLSEFGQRRYHTYPHCEGFADAGGSVVLGQIEESHVSLWLLDLRDGKERCVARFHRPADARSLNETAVWFDVAAKDNLLVAVAEGAAWRIDLDSRAAPRLLWRPPAGTKIDPLPSVTSDGHQALFHFAHGGVHSAVIIDLAANTERWLPNFAWHANHFHFSPCDPEWIVFCHEGDCRTISDRLWAWHPRHAPIGRCLFDQHAAGPGRFLQMGHERACWHAPSLLVPAFGHSPVSGAGLYEVFFDQRPPRFVGPSDRDWHCNVSRDGQWAVVDTTGPHDVPGKGWEQAADISDIMLVHVESGRRDFLARSHQRMHPWHPHPSFSPDGRHILYGETGPDPEPSTGRIHLLTRSKVLEAKTPRISRERVRAAPPASHPRR